MFSKFVVVYEALLGTYLMLKRVAAPTFEILTNASLSPPLVISSVASGAGLPPGTVAPSYT
jgi:hypothetical protein